MSTDVISGPPVFVVGCARSGTTLLYHMLVSSGGFANYRAETHLYDMVLPRYGSLESPEVRLELLRDWLDSRQAETTDLTVEDLRPEILAECRTGGDFLNILFGKLAQRQGVDRWAECTPLHLLYMDRIKEEVPDALFVHVIRDGRDVALSMSKTGWVNPLVWDRNQRLMVAAWEWEWRVRRGRRIAASLRDDYREVRFEELVSDPASTLQSLEGFVDYPLDWETIQKNAVGTLNQPNTAFDAAAGGSSSSNFDPVGRWQRQASPEDIAGIEKTVAGTLTDLGYPLSSDDPAEPDARFLNLRKRIYQAYRSLRQEAKDRTGLSRFLTRSYMQHA